MHAAACPVTENIELLLHAYRQFAKSNHVFKNTFVSIIQASRPMNHPIQYPDKAAPAYLNPIL